MILANFKFASLYKTHSRNKHCIPYKMPLPFAGSQPTFQQYYSLHAFLGTFLEAALAAHKSSSSSIPRAARMQTLGHNPPTAVEQP